MTSYTGSGPYCYANSLAMMLGEGSPLPGVIEVLTGSPFGFELIGGKLPLFDPYGWTPEIGLDAAVELLGWTCQRSDGHDPAEALARLTAALAAGPVLAGPLDMGLLLYQPGTPADLGDHYLVVLGIEDGTVLLHDPHGHPCATLPVDAFLDAWRGAGQRDRLNLGDQCLVAVYRVQPRRPAARGPRTGRVAGPTRGSRLARRGVARWRLGVTPGGEESLAPLGVRRSPSAAKRSASTVGRSRARCCSASLRSLG